MTKKTKTNVQRIHQSLSAAVSSINLAKNLLKDLEKQLGVDSVESNHYDIPGITGTFDGGEIHTESGERYQVPQNYASKSKLVYGDTLKMVDTDGDTRFKQIERVKRASKTGIFSLKDDKPVVVTSDGSYDLLAAAVKFYDLKEGDELRVLLPQDNLHAPFAAIDENVSKPKTQPSAEEDKVEDKKQESKKERSKDPKPAKTTKKVENSKKELDEKATGVGDDKKKSMGESDSAAKKTAAKVNAIADDSDEEKTISRIVGDDDLR